MSIKTEYGYNEDNFIEKNGELEELTVTVTLEEYRNLIKELCYNEKAIEELQEHNEKLRRENELLRGFILKKMPAVTEKIEEIIKIVMSELKGLCDTNETEGMLKNEN